MTQLTKTVKVLVILIIVFFAVLTIIVVACDVTISKRSDKYIYDSVDNVPVFNSAVVLGTAKYTNGGINAFFQYRIDAAVELYNSGKIKYLIVSGDNSRAGYNEPLDMKKSLVEEGVPADIIFLDYAGFRTLDSVVRAKEVFGQERYIVVSQKFHNQRAVFLARTMGMDVYGYNAKDLTGKGGLFTHIREKFARVKAIIDLLIGKQPKFLGQKIDIENTKPAQ